MFSAYRSYASALSAVIVSIGLTGCGLDSVVGGNCASGYVEAGGKCVPGSIGGTGPKFDNQDKNPNVSTDKDPTSTTIEPNTSTPEVGEQKPTFPELIPPTFENPTAPQPEFPPTQPVTPETPQTITCDPPLVLCRGVCISVDSDPMNCGACGRICPSNICVAGVCQGATPGDVVVIGHDMASTWSGSVQAKVLSNAVAIPTTDPIRVLSYESPVDSSITTNTRNVLRSNISGRSIQFTYATADNVDNMYLYASYDVVLIHGAPSSSPASLGTRWAPALTKFTKSGGVLVAIDGGNTDMPGLVSATGLLSIGWHQKLLAGTQLTVTAPNDTIGAKLLSPYSSFGTSVGFEVVTPESQDVRYVVRTNDESEYPVVIHKVVR
jgi:hypothetical protein